jgi:hypothetical protein
VYTCYNELHEGLHARHGEGRWLQGISRASDNDVTRIRAVYLDFDAERPRNISSSDREKRAAYEASFACERYLSSALGDDLPLGRGDSGNGYSLFIAIDPIPTSPDTRRRVELLLKAISLKFSVPGVKVDTSVGNPARLCPAFGTQKKKGVDTPDRPHRPTYFSCRHIVRRVALEVLA